MSKNRKSIQKHKYCGSFVIMLRNEFRYDIEEIESHLINNFLIHLSTRPGEIFDGQESNCRFHGFKG